MSEGDKKDQSLREVVAVFSEANALESAVDELLSFGFDKSQVTLLASEDAIMKKLGHKYRKVEELEDNPTAPRARYISTEALGAAKGGLIGGLLAVGGLGAAGLVLASGGALALAMVSAALGAEFGGLIGAIFGEFIEDHHAKYYQDQLRHGGLLLWVRTSDEAQESAAKEILSRHSGRDVHAHTILQP